MNHNTRLEDVFGNGGLLSRNVTSFEHRDSQLKMAEMVTAAFAEDHFCAVEAGTGTGKSFAYLVPAMLWCSNPEHADESVIVATSTINLQHQLVDKDLPFLKKALNLPLSYELLKGRSNYLCLRKLYEELREGPLLDTDSDDSSFSSGLTYLLGWAKRTRTGMLSEVEKPIDRQLSGRVCSDSDTCMKNRCPFREGCFVLQARKRAAEANIVIINHHLLFADILMREHEGIGADEQAILPPYDRLIIDEAHNIEKNATNYYTETFESLAAVRHLNDLHHLKFGMPRGIAVRLLPFMEKGNTLESFIAAGDRVRKAIDELDIQLYGLSGYAGGGSIRFTSGPSGLPADVLSPVVEAALLLSVELLHMQKECGSLAGLCRENEDSTPLLLELQSIARRFGKASDILVRFREVDELRHLIFWLEPVSFSRGRGSARMHITPVSVSHELFTHVFAANRTVICTSATLSAGSDFSFWEKQVGLFGHDDNRYFRERFSSPFDFTSQMLLGIPSDAPAPSEVLLYKSFVCDFTGKLILSSEGGTLVLFTSYALLREVGEYLTGVLKDQDIHIFKQGEMDRSKLLAEFIADEKSVLLATESFWEGVDAPGNTLRSVVITRIPFRVPTDPVVSARYDAVKESGGNPFTEMSLPEAALKLKQGFGRLLRHRNDRGGVFILDSRILHKYYGKVLLKSLPAARLEVREADSLLDSFENFLFADINADQIPSRHKKTLQP